MLINFVKKSNNYILWIYGKSGYGKTYLANSLVKQCTNRKTCFIETQELVDGVMVNIRKRRNISYTILNYQKYNLLVLDNLDLTLLNKPATQLIIKDILLKIIENQKTKIVLISQNNPNRLKNLNLKSQYLSVSKPKYRIKIKVLKNWLKEKNISTSCIKILNIASKADNFFELKGLFNKSMFIKN